MGEEAAPHPATISFEVVIESIQVFPEPPLLQENCTMVLIRTLHYIFFSAYHPLFSLAQRLWRRQLSGHFWWHRDWKLQGLDLKVLGQLIFFITFESLRPVISVPVKKILTHLQALIKITLSPAASLDGSSFFSLSKHVTSCTRECWECQGRRGARSSAQHREGKAYPRTAQSGSSSIS